MIHLKMSIVSMVFVMVIASAFGMTPTAVGDPLTLEMVGHRVIFEKQDGKEIPKLTPLPDIVEQGDIVQYDINGKNVSKQPLTTVKAEGKIPEGTSYIEDSARGNFPHTVLFSIDGGKTFHQPPLHEAITLKDGTEKKVVITPDRYTNIRFVLEKLQPDETFTCSYGVIVK